MIAYNDGNMRPMLGQRTKSQKKRLLQLVQDDPFLRADEMATELDTTPRYVRTTLSDVTVAQIIDPGIEALLGRDLCTSNNS